MQPTFRSCLPCAVIAFCAFAATIAVGQLPDHESPNRESPDRESVDVDGVTFSLSPGLELKKVASQPLIKWPIVADFDSQGRLVVAESGGVGWPIQEHNEKQLHRIVRLVDTDRDGIFDKRIVAADKLAFPEGVLCIGDDILVSAPPAIWKLTDADNDGICEERQIWFDGTTVTNCANDLHGPYLGRDGWIYWCKGAFGEQKHELLDGRTLESSAAHIYRRSLDGGRIEPLIAGGMDNPVEVAFTPEGEKFFTSTFLQHPGNGLRDGIGHAVYGSLFGKDHHVIEGHVRTGSLMPIMTQLGPAAPSGLICLDSDAITRNLADSSQSRFLCAALFNLHKVTAHQLVSKGASFETTDINLLSTDRVDFHPTDVLEDADGSLLILDTGGWYDLCCPTSRVDQKTAEGGIYRLSNADVSGRDRLAEPIDWSTVELDSVVSLRTDERPWVRRRAAEFLVEAADQSVIPLSHQLLDPEVPLDTRLAALWTLCQIGSPDAVGMVATQLASDSTSLAQAACHVIGLHRDSRFTTQLQTLLRHESALVRRAAAEAVGRSGSEDSIPHLLAALDGAEGDRHLEHSLLYGLMELGRRNPNLSLADTGETPDRFRARIMVLEQLGRGNELNPSRLLSAATGENESLRKVAAETLSKHSEWAGELVDSLQMLWSNLDDAPTSAEGLAEIIAAWRDEPEITQLLQRWLSTATEAEETQQEFLAENLDRFSNRKLAPSWMPAIAQWMRQSSAEQRNVIADGIADLDLSSTEHSKLRNQIIELAEISEKTSDRLQLLAACELGSELANAKAEREAVALFFEPDGPYNQLASRVLLRCKLSASQSDRLVRNLHSVAPQHLMTAIEVVHASGEKEVERAMLHRLEKLPAARTLPRGFLANLYKSGDDSLRKLANRITKELESPPEDIKQAVQEMLASLDEGDPTRGLQIFRGTRAACSGCHKMGYIGTEIGPNLTRIGGSRTPEALLEAILFPSARLEQSYQSTQVLTVDGQILNGLLVDQSEQSLELQVNAERRVSIPREDVDQIASSNVSVMPQGLAKVLSKQELADLLALLRSAK